MSRVLKRYGYQEYFINDTHIKKLYGMYLDKSLYNKILDKLVFFSFVTIVMSVVLPYFSFVHPTTLILVNAIASFVLIVFAFELLRSYVHSRSSRDFLRKHWVDFMLVSFLSFYFLFITTLHILNIKVFDVVKVYLTDAKHFRAFVKLILRR